MDRHLATAKTTLTHRVVKIAKFSHPRVFYTPVEGVPLGIGYRRSGSKNRIMRLPGRERGSTISSAVWIQCTKVTDGHRVTAKIAAYA